MVCFSYTTSKNFQHLNRFARCHNLSTKMQTHFVVILALPSVKRNWYAIDSLELLHVKRNVLQR